jgi:ParB/RepB/Spo0J family partition protein
VKCCALPVGQLQPGKYQPRREMDEGKLSELADSIKSQGVIQPILVRQLPAGNYEIVAGERRWRDRSWPAWTKCRWWCASWKTAPSSRWR